MKKSQILVLMLFNLIQLFIINQVFSQEDENIWYSRERYFFIQRGSPYDSVSTGALNDALQEKITMGPGGYYLQGTNWNNIGPAPIDRGYGMASGRYNSGRVNTVKYLNSSTIYIGAAAGGVWKTDNYNTNSTDWQNMSSGLKSLSTGALAVDNSDPNNPVIYYATGEGNYGFVYSYLGLGLFKSTNGGSNWIQIYTGSGLPTKNVRYFKLVIRPGFNNQIFAASNMGLFRSIDAGNSWSIVTGTENLQCNDIIFSNSNNLHAYVVGPNLTTGGVEYKRSFDGGNSFNIQQGSGLNIAGRTHLAICRDNNQVIYLVTDLGRVQENPPLWNIKVYRSTNGGNSFESFSIVSIDTYGGYCLCIAAKPNDDNTVFVGASGLYKSTNGGQNFCAIAGNQGLPFLPYCVTYDFMHADFHNIDFNPSNSDEMIIATDGGPYLSTNSGIFWHSMNVDEDFSISQIYRVSSNNLGPIGGVQDEGHFSKSVGSLTWEQVGPTGDGTGVLFSRFNNNIWFGFIGNDGRLLKTGIESQHNFGNGWDGGNDWIGALTEHPLNAGTFFTARRQNTTNVGTWINFWKTEDYAEYWGEQPLSTISSNISPQNIEFSSKDPQTVYLSTSGYTGPWNSQVFGREIYKSSNGGGIWIAKVSTTDNNLPNLYITRMLTVPSDNPVLEDEIYVTLSSFNLPGHEGHVFKSTNGGTYWINITGNLPNIPVNDIVVWNESKTQKNLIVATDIGVFISANGGTTWRELAANLPNTIIMDLEYRVFENKLRVATFGRGVWDVNLPGDIYIKGIYSSQPPTNLSKNIFVCNNSKLILKNPISTLNISNGKKINIEDGGSFEANAITFSGQNWEGVIFNGNSQGILNNCTFVDNFNPSIKILGGIDIESYNNISILNSTFNSTGNVSIDTRDNVTISNCIWINSGINIPNIWGIESIGSNNITITSNRFNESELGSSDLNSTTISIIYGNNVVISKNRIFASRDGIQISNSSAVILDNYINHEFEPGSAQNGITLDNSYSSVLSKNVITEYFNGIYLNNSSPLMLENIISNNSVLNTALYAEYNSSPRLRPQELGGQTIWDAGKNSFETSFHGNNIGIYLHSNSIPDLDNGCNTINSDGLSIQGDIFECNSLFYNVNARYNNWNNFSESVCDADFDIYPTGCINGGGGSEKDGDIEIGIELIDPPQPIIINYGNGIYDTIDVTNRNVDLTTDQSMYLEANNDELLGNYSSAITKYGQIIQNYQDSLTAINSLRKLLHCNDKLHSDTSAYTQLRQLYQGLIQANITDTFFVNVAEELAAKCLVRMGHPTDAINEYEEIIANSNDSSKILCAELNIIETYLIIQQSGDSPNFSGQLGYLKPVSKVDAYKKILDRLHKNKNSKTDNQIPKEYQLSQNYPNPFNPVTKIKYALPNASNVTLKVYDILGREVISLVNEFKDAGSYIVEFNGSNYASGVYFFRIEAEGQNGRKYVERKKMVLVK